MKIQIDSKLLNVDSRKIVEKRALKYAKKNLLKIKVSMGTYMGNQRCYHNARQHLEMGEGDRIASVIAFLPDGRGANLHFVNKVDKRYLDHTFGYQAKFIKYYLIREYTLNDLKHIKIYASIIDELQDEILNKLFTKEEREIYEIKREHF